MLRTTGRVWQFSSAGKGPWQTLVSSGVKASEVYVGKFDRDRISDVFYGNGKTWMVKWGGRGSWHEVRTSAYQTSQLSFGDFNGDGITDVLAANGTRWMASYWHPARSRFTNWTVLNTNRTEKAQFGVGDFNLDHLTDVFIATGRGWFISSAARSVERKLSSSTVLRSQTALANVIGNSAPDIITFVP